MLNVSTRSVASAKQVLKTGTPELQQAVRDGKIKVSKAATIAKGTAAEQSKSPTDSRCCELP